MAAPPTTLERLRIFHAVAASGSIAGAARTLGYTPSAVSQHVAALEREAGVALVERSNRGIELTAVGVHLASGASDVLDLASNTFEQLHEVAEHQFAPITVAAFPTAISAMLMPLFAAPRPPLVSILHAESEHAVAALIDRRVDAAIVDGLADGGILGRRTDLHRVLLRVEPIWLVTTKRHRSSDLADYADADWVLGPTETRLGVAARDRCRVAGFEPRVVTQTQDHRITFDVVIARRAVSMLPELALTDVPSGVRVVRAAGEMFQRRIEVVTRYPHHHHPVVAELVDRLIDNASDRSLH